MIHGRHMLRELLHEPQGSPGGLVMCGGCPRKLFHFVRVARTFFPFKCRIVKIKQALVHDRVAPYAVRASVSYAFCLRYDMIRCIKSPAKEASSLTNLTGAPPPFKRMDEDIYSKFYKVERPAVENRNL